MPADLSQPFRESCCDGGVCAINDTSARSCGCDPGEHYTCKRHKDEYNEIVAGLAKDLDCTPEDVIQYAFESVGASRVSEFVVKDSGKREVFSGGMQRDSAEDKVDYTLLRDGPMYYRWAEHLRKGALKYGKRNWMKGVGQVELDRAMESALRHMEQWYRGDIDEDHAAAVMFNLNQAEHLKLKMSNKKPQV